MIITYVINGLRNSTNVSEWGGDLNKKGIYPHLSLHSLIRRRGDYVVDSELDRVQAPPSTSIKAPKSFPCTSIYLSSLAKLAISINRGAI